jgi:Ca2+/H+ antiporter
MDRLNLKYLLILIPVAIGLSWSRANPILVFLASALAIVPLAGLMGDATDALAKFLGPTVGSLLNASLANAPEIIISGFALHAGLVNMVKSSLTGSIIGNLLLGLGVSFFAGGIKHRRNQRFNPHAARMTTALLTLASFGLIIPGVTPVFGEQQENRPKGCRQRHFRGSTVAPALQTGSNGLSEEVANYNKQYESGRERCIHPLKIVPAVLPEHLHCQRIGAPRSISRPRVTKNEGRASGHRLDFRFFWCM